MLNLTALREAAVTLLAEAPLPLVKATLRALLDGSETTLAPAPSGEAAPASARQQEPLAPKPAVAPGTKRTRPLPVPDAAWDERRAAIRTAMIERGTNYQALASKLHVKPATIKHALHRRVPPGETMRRRLDAWLKTSAPAVAAEPPFRPNGAGSLRTDTAASD